MRDNIVKYYGKVTNLALINLKNEKAFNMKSRLNNDLLLMQSKDHLERMYKMGNGSNTLSKEAKNEIDQYMKSIKDMHKLAVNDYKKTLQKLKNTPNVEDKQKILDDYAKRGIHGFTAKDGKHWNIETYSNMYFTHMHNTMLRMGKIDEIKSKGSKYIKISTHRTICNLCKPYEGKTMLIEELKNTTLFHPHCKHYVMEV